ncbi:hypothetical protein FE783_00555 [Paenibacillus mesophilus]|uniref:hypothetical protein n=1 Tax=Paenibacillus mesophilus TaxID=2582849 RepID=UPI00110EC4F3|nr:hypothetical protein [Paenibacillus mesophilus]TMV52721.1 hypothetical protein FE783_00555 [Paenibacillus mesophilus]
MPLNKFAVITAISIAAALSGCSSTAPTGDAGASSTKETSIASADASPSTPAKVTVGAFTQEKITPEQRTIPPTYTKFFKKSDLGPVIPGLQQGLVPQGIAYFASRNWIVISSYRDKAPSVLSVIDLKTNKLLKTVLLYENDTTPYMGHAGGIAISAEHLWVGSDSLVRAVRLDDVVNAKDGGRVPFREKFGTETKASFLAYSDGILWAGDYSDKEYPTDASHHMTSRDNKAYKAWAAGYKIDKDTDLIGQSHPVNPAAQRAIPDYIFAVADKIQGFAVHEGKVWLSQSGGRANDSYLLGYTDVRGEEPHLRLQLAGREVPLWYLDGKNMTDTWIMPPMSEGLDTVKDKIAVLFESGAKPYLSQGTFPVDQIYLFSPK